MSRKSTGIDRKMSTMRIMTASSDPPKNPATAPQVTPTTVATREAVKPTSSDDWPPYMRRPRMSKPVPSVPSGCPLPGGALRELLRAAWALVWFVW